MNVLSLCGPESGLPKNPSVSNPEGLCQGLKYHVIPWRTDLSPFLPFLIYLTYGINSEWKKDFLSLVTPGNQLV